METLKTLKTLKHIEAVRGMLTIAFTARKGADALKKLANVSGWPSLIGGTLAVIAGVFADSDTAIFFGAIVAGAGAVIIGKQEV
ncbi:MAG: hypothetical protein HDS67_02355 [Bacteroidales bacterium]|nr:hypothetical protein [Bacteroidales bacterium]